MKTKKHKTLITLTIIILLLVLTACKNEKDIVEELKEIEEDEEKIIIYYFWGTGCPRCDVQEPFMNYLEQKYEELEIIRLEIHENEANYDLLKKLSQVYGERIGGAPTTFIGEEHPFIGFGDESTTGKLIEERIQKCILDGCKNPIEIIKEQKLN